MMVSVHVFWRTRQGGFLVIDPLNMFWGGIIVCYVVQPIAYFNQISEFQPTGDIPGALAWILGGLLCVIVGYESRLGAAMGRVVPPGPACLGRWRLAFLGLVSVVAGVAGYSYEISTAGGFDAWLAVPRGGTDWEVASSYVVLLTTLLPLGVALLLFAAEFGRGPALVRAAVWICGLLLLFRLVHILGTRSRSILWVITLLTAYYLPRRKNPPLALIMLLFPLLLVGSSFLVQNRDRFTDLSLNLSLQEASERWHSAVRDALGYGEQGYRREIQAGLEFNYVLAAIELVPAQVSYTYGYNFLEILTPPDSPRDLGKQALPVGGGVHALARGRRAFFHLGDDVGGACTDGASAYVCRILVGMGEGRPPFARGGRVRGDDPPRNRGRFRQERRCLTRAT